MNSINQPKWWQSLSEGIIRLFLVIISVLLIMNLIRSVSRNYEVSREIYSLKQNILNEEDQKALLNQEIVFEQTKTFKELTARKLGFLEPGENLVLVPQNRDPKDTSDGPNNSLANSSQATALKIWEEKPYYEQWWLLFFGPTSMLEDTFGG